MRRFLFERFRSFSHAFAGLFDLFMHHTHAKIHLFFILSVTLFGFYVQLDPIEWCIVILCYSMVVGAEAFNSAIEYLCDKVHPEHDPQIAKVKDIAAAAVLVVSIGAFCIGLILFFPKLISCLPF